MANLNVLIVEDCQDDAEMLMAELRASGFNANARRVDSEPALLAALAEEPPADIVLSDFQLRQFDGFRALELLQSHGYDIPFILVSGTAEEALALEVVRRGAADYLMKDRLGRLGPAVSQALERRLTRDVATERQRQLETLISNLPGVVYRCRNDAHYTTEFVSDGIADLTGHSAASFLAHGLEFGVLIHRDDRDRVWSEIQAAIRAGQPFVVSYRIIDAAGTEKWVRDVGRGVLNGNGVLVALEGFIADVTERRSMELALQDSELKFRELVEQAADGIVVYDPQRRFVFANSRALELFGATNESLLGSDIIATYASTDLDTQVSLQAERMAAASRGRVVRYERHVRRMDGSTFPADISLKQLPNGQFQAIFDDVTERHLREQRIARLTDLHRARSSISAAIVRSPEREYLLREICRIAVDEGGFSLAWIGLLDTGGSQLRRVAQAGTAGEDQGESANTAEQPPMALKGICEVALRERRPVAENAIEKSFDETIVQRIATEAGQRSAIALPLIVAGQPAGVLALYSVDQDSFESEETRLLTGLAEDVSLGLEYKMKDEQVRFLSNYDPLTGLANRNLFLEQLAVRMLPETGPCRSGVLVLIDIDRFRVINGALGRAVADALIVEVSRRIREPADEDTIIARVGADSFAIVMPAGNTPDETARTVEAQVRAWFDRPFQVAGHELRIAATAGIAAFPEDAVSPAPLFANAEAALRDAALQHERLRFYRSDLQMRAAESLRMESGLRRALEHGELVMWYQPKLSARTGRITGVEALMRWKDPIQGMISPAKFIPTMEQTGMIAEAGRWALQAVARDCERWRRAGLQPPRIAINVSALQLEQRDFLDSVVAAVGRVRDAGSMLDLEITESTIMRDFDAIVCKLRTLCGLGVQIAIDDFGTGYSSLAYIARLPIHALKIDRGFVARMKEMNGSLAVVRSVISLAHALQLQVIAEGVETQDQAETLLQLGCDELQGFLIARPMPHAAAGVFLRDWHGLEPAEWRREKPDSSAR